MILLIVILTNKILLFYSLKPFTNSIILGSIASAIEKVLSNFNFSIAYFSFLDNLSI